MMTPQEAKKLYADIGNIFTFQSDIINLTTSQSITLTQAKADVELNRFFGLDDDGPYSEFLKLGLKSLRMGFYKISASPFYNNSLFPGTFVSEVLYLHPYNSKLIKYNCNIGPMTNSHKIYHPMVGTLSDINQIPILKDFEYQKYSIGTSGNHFMIPKRNFFNSTFTNGKLFFVKESVWHPNYPNLNPRPKQVTWCFIN